MNEKVKESVGGGTERERSKESVGGGTERERSKESEEKKYIYLKRFKLKG